VVILIIAVIGNKSQDISGWRAVLDSSELRALYEGESLDAVLRNTFGNSRYLVDTESTFLRVKSAKEVTVCHAVCPYRTIIENSAASSKPSLSGLLFLQKPVYLVRAQSRVRPCGSAYGVMGTWRLLCFTRVRGLHKVLAPRPWLRTWGLATAGMRSVRRDERKRR
jgi:hypothetical protein